MKGLNKYIENPLKWLMQNIFDGLIGIELKDIGL